MLGLSEGGATSVVFASRYLELVRSLVVYGTFMQFGSGAERSERTRAQQEAVVTLVEQGWGLDTPMFRQMFTAAQLPAGSPDQIAYFDEMQRASATPETAAKFLQSVLDTDVTEEAGQAAVPTLVMHRRGDLTILWRWGQQLASQIPGAEFRMLGGENHQVWVGDEPEVVAVVEAVAEFSDGATRAPSSAALTPQASTGGVITILFSDVEASTELTDRLGDVAARDLLAIHDALTREALVQHAGREIKTMGDGFMASFDSPAAAIDCAVALQRSLAVRFADSPPQVRVRIGLNSGEPIVEGDDLYGTAVIQAARVMGLADGVQILATDTVRSLVAGKNFDFENAGEHALKGFEESVRLWNVRWE